MFERSAGGGKEGAANGGGENATPGRDVPSSSPVDAALATAGSGERVGGAVLHTDGVAANAASSMNAHAFAAGQDVYFGAGAYAPHTPAGDQLIAHEMAHVDQARGVAAPEPGNYAIAPSSAPQEVAAREVAGGGAGGGATAAPNTIYRAEIGEGVAANVVKHGGTAEAGATAGGHDGAQYNLLAARGAGEDDRDPLQAFRVAIVAGNKSNAKAKWTKVPAADKVKLKDEHDTLLRSMQVLGPDALGVLKDAGVDPTADVRYAQEILWHGSAAAWKTALTSQGMLTTFLKGAPRGTALDKKSLTNLKDYTADAASAQDAFEKAYAPLKSGNVALNGDTYRGQAWDQDHIHRLYVAILSGHIPPSHFTGSQGIYIASQWENPTGSAPQGIDWGYYDGAGTIIMPLYAGAGNRDHDMVGATASRGPRMAHFASSALHETGHLVADTTGEYAWGTTAASPLKLTASTPAEVQTELWDPHAVHALAKGVDPVPEADAKTYLEQEALGVDAFASTTWALKDRATFDGNLRKQYRDQPLYKMAKAVNGAVTNAYTHPMAGKTTTDMMFAYLSRAGNSWCKYTKEAYDKKVSFYSLSSAVEWFAEQYSYYMATSGNATIPAVKTKLEAVMKKIDKDAGAPAMGSPGAGAGAGAGAGGATGVDNAAAQAPPRQASTSGHRFEVSWS